MRVTIAQLEAFYWVARLGKFRDAARHLHLAQPTVSLRIRELELQLGVRLFERQRRDAWLTSDGEVLFDLASTILADVRKVYERLGSTGIVQGVLRAGMPENFALVCLPELLGVVSRDHPKLKVELAIGTSARLSRDLEEHTIDIAIVTNPAPTNGLQLIPLCSHQMAWGAHPDLVTSDTITPGDIRGLPVISNPPPEPQHQMIVEWFQSAGLAPLFLSTCTSVTVIAQLVASGVGLSLLPVSLLSPLADAGKLRILQARPRPPLAQVYCAYHASEGGANINAALRIIRDVSIRTGFSGDPSDAERLVGAG